MTTPDPTAPPPTTPPPPAVHPAVHPAASRTTAAGTFGEQAWRRTAEVRAGIAALPFLAELADASLAPESFRHYLEQDALYLAGYARALSSLAARAPDTAAAQFWAGSAQQATVVEAALHADMLSGELTARPGEQIPVSDTGRPDTGVPGTGTPRLSPTSLGYVSYLVATAATAPYAVGAAAVLPCFWVYADVGVDLLRRGAPLLARDPRHPCARWIAAYAGEDFQTSTAQARALVDEAAAAHPQAVPAMHEAFEIATRYEHAFWDAAHRLETWPPV